MSTDLATPDLRPTCRSDVDCPGPDFPRCDVAHSECVMCLPSSDNCPPGVVCQNFNGTWICSCGCASHSDCNKLGRGSLCCRCTCVNGETDPGHCGGCDNACPPNTQCVMGSCR